PPFPHKVLLELSARSYHVSFTRVSPLLQMRQRLTPLERDTASGYRPSGKKKSTSPAMMCPDSSRVVPSVQGTSRSLDPYGRNLDPSRWAGTDRVAARWRLHRSHEPARGPSARGREPLASVGGRWMAWALSWYPGTLPDGCPPAMAVALSSHKLV